MEKLAFWLWMLICTALSMGNLYYGVSEIIEGQYVTGGILITLALFLFYVMGISLGSYLRDHRDDEDEEEVNHLNNA